MKMVADAHIPYIQEYFGAYGELILKPGRTITRADVQDADILLVRSVTHVDEKLLGNSTVKFVGSVTAGADHLDTQWLKAAGIDWCVAVGFNAPPVADYVLSVIAALQKKALLTPKKMRAAVIGVGNVGRLVAERLRWLNCDVVLCDPIRASQESDFQSVPLTKLDDVDFISLHVPLIKHGNHPTYHFIDKQFLQKQKPGCILLNAARGSVINSSDLLNYGTHLQWCFDVWEHEPNINKAILEKVVIGTPHIAGYSVQSKIRGIEMIYRMACEKKLIEPQPITPIKMPTQHLAYTGSQLTWEDILLGVFNPFVITDMMRTVLLPMEEYGSLFDEMRHQFNYRYEFQYTHLKADVLHEDKECLKRLGVMVEI
jgi:erythronate-4-phosphate dehydrogenase